MIPGVKIMFVLTDFGKRNKPCEWVNWVYVSCGYSVARNSPVSFPQYPMSVLCSALTKKGPLHADR